ncbi:hypothetical protein COHA_009347 [Chlorella ohadii]|uniref:Uncharacterized protein n=1 Tax=Chlorella ohadii TaxID=2649997 RepID=A0AAD5DFN0_9CHLO|nr:hypothetical protein COHA_009347 [Chlorella ohadii]
MDPAELRTDPSELDTAAERARPKKAISIGKLSDLSSPDLGAAKTVGVVTDPANAPMENVPRSDAPPEGKQGA